MIQTYSDFKRLAEFKVKTFDEFCKSHALEDISIVDHFGYKCGSKEEYEQLRNLFEHESVFIYQSIISNRRISIIKLIAPVDTCLGPIFYLELSDQKPDNSQKSGFDHFEILSQDNDYSFLVSFCTERSIELSENKKLHHSTYDINQGSIKIKLSREALIEKIKREEMV